MRSRQRDLIFFVLLKKTLFKYGTNHIFASVVLVFIAVGKLIKRRTVSVLFHNLNVHRCSALPSSGIRYGVGTMVVAGIYIFRYGNANIDLM